MSPKEKTDYYLLIKYHDDSSTCQVNLKDLNGIDLLSRGYVLSSVIWRCLTEISRIDSELGLQGDYVEAQTEFIHDMLEVSLRPNSNRPTAES